MVKYKPEHLKQLNRIRDCVPDNLEEKIAEYELNGVVFTIMYGEQPIALCGAIKLWDGVAEIWFLTTDHIEEHKTFFYREVVRLMNQVQKEQNIHRMQCTVETDFTQCQKWLEGLGFVIEGVMLMYGPDRKNHYRYAKLWHF